MREILVCCHIYVTLMAGDQKYVEQEFQGFGFNINKEWTNIPVDA